MVECLYQIRSIAASIHLWVNLSVPREGRYVLLPLESWLARKRTYLNDKRSRRSSLVK